MNDEQQELIYDYSSRKITEEKLIELLFAGEGIPEDYLFHELESTLANKDVDSVECLLIFGFVFGISDKCSDALSRLLIEDWHFRHEDIASALQSLKWPGSVDYLFKTALTDYPYTGSKFALGVKCIHALREIGTDSAREKLRLLAQADNPVLAERAGRILAYM